MCVRFDVNHDLSEKSPTLLLFNLHSRRIALERRQFVCVLHPNNSVGNLDLRSRRHCVGVVIGRALDVDNPR